MKTLLAGTSYIRNPYQLWIAEQWVRLGKLLNPNTDLLIVDSDSPLRPEDNLPDIRRTTILQLGDNIGHLTYPAPYNKDGWGRATCEALDWAVDYDYVATIDLDVIYVDPVEPIFTWMAENNIRVANPREPNYKWLEGITFWDTGYLKDSAFTSRYNWPSRGPQDSPQEYLMEGLMGEALTVIDLPGMRDDTNTLTPENLFMVFPSGISWLTHCQNKAVYLTLMARYGIAPGPENTPDTPLIP